MLLLSILLIKMKVTKYVTEPYRQKNAMHIANSGVRERLHG